MANPFPFVAGQILTASQLNSIGESAVVYTPTLTNLTLGNGTINAKYVRVNKLVFVQISLVFGSTSSMGSNPSFSLPVAGAGTLGGAQGWTRILDSGVAFYMGTVAVNTTAATPNVSGASGTYVTEAGGLTATVPMTWTTNDTLYINFMYEAA
jgi:hypothetical protein